MPIYEFVCEKCGHEFEELVSGKDTGCICPKCGTSKTRKLMSACVRNRGDRSGQSSGMSSGGGCAGCSGGNCASCGC